MTIAIRELGLADTMMLEELLDAMQPEWSNEMAPGASGPMAFISQPRSFVFGAYVDNEPAGWLWGLQTLRPDGRRMSYVHQLDVIETQRRKGIATSLIEAAVSLARRDGSHRIWLTTAKGNGAARALYERTGATYRSEDGDIIYSWDL